MQRKIAIKTALYSLVLTLFGISVDDFRLAGGLVLLLIALNMLNGGLKALLPGLA